MSLFLTCQKPLLTCMVQADTPSRIKELVAKALPEGAEAIGMQFCKMLPEYRRPEVYRELFSLSGLPTYVTNYRGKPGRQNIGKSDEVLGDELVELAECGATLCDVMGDFYDPTEGELTTDPAAIARQRELIDRIHDKGGEVLMSSHVLKFTPAERVLEIALEQERRGADICKIVTRADNMSEQIENIKMIDILRQNLKIPFLYLAGGECHLMRRIGGEIGCCMYLCVHEHDELATKSQPLLSDVREIRRLLSK